MAAPPKTPAAARRVDPLQDQQCLRCWAASPENVQTCWKLSMFFMGLYGMIV